MNINKIQVNDGLNEIVQPILQTNPPPITKPVAISTKITIITFFIITPVYIVILAQNCVITILFYWADI